MKENRKILTVMVAVIGLLASACAPNTPAPDPVVPSNANTGGETSVEDNSGDEGVSQLGQLGVSLGRTELQASDSSTVSLEGGNKPQLVEFFAYW